MEQESDTKNLDQKSLSQAGMRPPKMQLRGDPLTLPDEELIKSVASWLGENSETRLWALELGYLRVMQAHPNASSIWSSAMQVYFDEER